MNKIEITGVERTFSPDEIVVTKTDKKGIIQYANDVFIKLAGYTEDDLLDKPHNVVRHPEMPKCIFKLLWDTISEGKEIFAYVVNLSKNGDHYWVYAHVTPWFNSDNQVDGFHSARRVPNRNILEGTIIPLYKDLLNIERSASSKIEGLEKSYKELLSRIESSGFSSYEEFIHSL